MLPSSDAQLPTSSYTPHVFVTLLSSVSVHGVSTEAKPGLLLFGNEKAAVLSACLSSVVFVSFARGG